MAIPQNNRPAERRSLLGQLEWRLMAVHFRHKLHYGPYRTPRFRYGQKVECLARGEVTITGISAARIPWPVGYVPFGKSPVLTGSLVRAVQREAACAVCYWWGVTPWLVRKWRRALGVPRWNEGDLLLKSANGKRPVMRKALKAMWAKARDPERRAKIAAARQGKPRPAHVTEALRQANTGRPLSAERRRKMSEAHKRRGTRPPKAGRAWEAWEDKLLRTLPAAEVAKRTGRGMAALYSRWHALFALCATSERALRLKNSQGRKGVKR